MQPRKQRAERARQKAKLDREAEEKKLKQNFERILSMSSGFKSESNTPVKVVLSGSLVHQKVFRRDSAVKVSRALPKPTLKVKPVIDDEKLEEMQRREASAREEIERKKKRVAVTVNKGAYQYITDGMDPKTFGRK
jgi:hypothetical protein